MVAQAMQAFLKGSVVHSVKFIICHLVSGCLALTMLLIIFSKKRDLHIHSQFRESFISPLTAEVKYLFAGKITSCL